MFTLNRKNFVEKYYGGKNDHTAYREWSIHKIGLTYLGGYLLLREVLYFFNIYFINSYLLETFMLDHLLCSYSWLKWLKHILFH